ncbi:N-acetylmuramoyl-L-alanine amidase LytC precursor [Limihaloglobus sulfuriphilus]|uniref:N-acetylmuramoyl-L-alanine amidase n=1 Tax=Limihaloglobus sulfuriphilus TaxID=1851148 RepID=A0A1Q2MI25_9BACT|nr:N-acetylmuramoyl-L-alanine amidase [Limihaloglobus sulfuriphilus]AQQ71912.1 N-acetylmuramoyl-L-alanine amidase LytC precursor [Limihaloglobus sulfuriphilus]
MELKKTLIITAALVAAIVFSGCNAPGTPQVQGKDPILKEKPAYKPYQSPKTYTPPASRGLQGKTIVIDPGHGGKDPGAGSVGFSPKCEKELNIAIAQKLASELKSKGARVIMTRNNDVFLELDDRASFADRYGADLLVSIHCDAHNRSDVDGATVYIARNPRTKSRQVAESIRKSLESSGIYTRGVRNADFRVLVKHSKPSVLIESGYLTNKTDAGRLNNNWYQGKLAKALAQGIENGL